MIDIVTQFLILIGLAAWMPAPTNEPRYWLGARFSMAGSAATIFIFVGNVVIGVPVSILSWSLLAIGSIGFLYALFRPTGRALLAPVHHPVFVFSALFFGATAFAGALSYQPYLGDEFTSWLNLARQIYLADHYWSDAMIYSYPSYTNGWPLLLAASTSVYSTYSDSHFVPLQFFLHLGVLGFTYDFLTAAAIRSGMARNLAGLVAWSACLVLLAGEVTWKLLPTDMLIEQPLLYAYALVLVAAIAGQYDDTAQNIRSSFYVGAALAVGYLFKISMTAICPAVGLLLIYYIWRDLGRNGPSPWSVGKYRAALAHAALLAALLFGPIAIASTIWSLASVGDQIKASLGAVENLNSAVLVSEKAFGILHRMGTSALAFGIAFKLPLTVIAGLAVLGGMMSQKLMPIVIVLIVFIATYVGAMFLAYIYRYGALDHEYLESFPRFIILPFRIVHYVGFVFLTLAAIQIATKYFPRASHAKTTYVFLGLLATAGLVWQASRLDRSIVDMTDRRYQNGALAKDSYIRSIQTIKTQVARLIVDIDAKKLSVPSVGILDPLGYGAVFSIVLYYSLKSERADTYHHFLLEWATSIKQWPSFDIMWPVTIEANDLRSFQSDALDPECAKTPTDYFIFRTAGDSYTCLARGLRP